MVAVDFGRLVGQGDCLEPNAHLLDQTISPRAPTGRLDSRKTRLNSAVWSAAIVFLQKPIVAFQRWIDVSVTILGEMKAKSMRCVSFRTKGVSALDCEVEELAAKGKTHRRGLGVIRMT